MPVYSKSDFSNANAAIAVLEQDAADATSLINTITSFKDNSTTVLKGASWDLVRSNLDVYIEALNNRKTNCETLASSIKAVNNSMIAAIGTNNSVNTDELDELERTYNRCVNIVNSNNSELTEKELMDNQILMQNTKELIDQIKKVQAAEQEAINKLASLTESNNSYNGIVENITPSRIISAAEV